MCIVSSESFKLLPYFGLQHCGLDLTNYPRLNAWYESCRVLKGFEDDQEAARQVGEYLRSKFPTGLEALN